MTKPAKDWDYYYFRARQIRIPDKWILLRKLGKETLSSKAQEKLEWIVFYHTIANRRATTTAAYFSITRKTVHKWLKRFDEKHLPTLEEKSKAPFTKRRRDISDTHWKKIKMLREQHIRWGKMKLAVEYKRLYGVTLSSWKFQIVIQEENLYYKKEDARKHRARRERSQEKKRITQLKKNEQVHYLWHVDTVSFTLSHGGYRYLLTAIDETSKLAYARVYSIHTSKNATDFLRRIHYLTEGEIINLHHDNGSEFMSNFITACRELSLPQYYSRVRTPKDNAVLERFNRTIQQECVDLMEIGLDNVAEANEYITDWLIEYNLIRPHQALGYLTPLQYIDKIKVSPMSSSSTIY